MPIPLRFVLTLAAGLAVGVHLEPPPVRVASWVLAVALAAAWLAWRLRVRGLPAALAGLAVLAGAALHGMHGAADAGQPPLRRWLDARAARDAAGEYGDPGVPIRLRGRLARDAAPGVAGTLLYLDVSHAAFGEAWEPARGGATLTVAGTLAADEMAAWRAGREVTVPARLRRPARYLNPGLPDFERALARRGTALVGSVKSAALVEVVATGWWWDETAAAIRAAVRHAMDRHVGRRDVASAAIGTAILIGDRARLAPEIERRLQEAGTYHVVAISGGNIALLTAAVVGLLWVARVRFAAAAWTAVAVLVAHAWIIGGGASVVRATIMASLYLALRAIDQRTAPVHAIAVGAALMLVARPLDVVDAGFWLTFGATTALLLLAARWGSGPGLEWRRAPLAIVAGSLAVELVLAPISAFVFQRVTLAGLALNLVAIPSMAVVQAAASACVLAGALGWGWLAAEAGLVTHYAAQALLASGQLVEWAPWTHWRVPSPPFWLLVGYYVLVAVWWWGTTTVAPARGPWGRHGWSAAALALWAWMAVAPQTMALGADSRRLRVTMLDVGQGDAVLVTLPNGRTLLVDTGGMAQAGGFDLGERVLGPALRARGLGRLDYLAVTHADADHVGGAAALVRDFRPSEVWAGIPVAGHAPQEQLRSLARAARSTWRWLQRGDRFESGGAEVIVHHPPPPDWERPRVRNDDSLVMEVRLGEVSIVLTGDISRAVEEELTAWMQPASTVVLKAAHHGSATSSAERFLARMRPVAVLVSAGRGNPHGHPSPRVLGRYADAGTAVFRTDLDGQIEATTDGHALEITTYSGRRWRRR